MRCTLRQTAGAVCLKVLFCAMMRKELRKMKGENDNESKHERWFCTGSDI